MSAASTYLICDSAIHAEVVDGLICARLQDVDGNKGSRWSGVYTDGARFGVLWAEPAEALFDPEEVELATTVIDTSGRAAWSEPSLE